MRIHHDRVAFAGKVNAEIVGIDRHRANRPHSAGHRLRVDGDGDRPCGPGDAELTGESEMFRPAAKHRYWCWVQRENREGIVASPEEVSVELIAVLSACLLPAGLLERPLGRKKKIGLDDLATVIFSSGSTREPKGVMLSHYKVISMNVSWAR